MLEATETLSSDLRAAAPVYLKDVNERGVVMLVTRTEIRAASPAISTWGVVRWLRLAEADERAEP